MSYLQNITSDVQNQLNNAVMFGDLSFNNNLIIVTNMSYVNGIYNTLSSYIRTTNTNLNNYQSYNYNMSTSISSNVYINYINRDTLTNKLLPYTLNTDFINTSTNLYNYMYSLSGIVNNDMNYCMNTFYTISNYII